MDYFQDNDVWRTAFFYNFSNQSVLLALAASDPNLETSF